jgi:hypothetical protein
MRTLCFPWRTALLLSTRPGSSASCREAIPHAKAAIPHARAVKTTIVKYASKSTRSHCFVVFLRCSLAVGLKRLGQAARGVQRGVHGVEQRQIAQLGTAFKVALRKDIAAHHHCFRLTSGLRSQNPLDFMQKWLARKW